MYQNLHLFTLNDSYLTNLIFRTISSPNFILYPGKISDLYTSDIQRHFFLDWTFKKNAQKKLE